MIEIYERKNESGKNISIGKIVNFEYNYIFEGELYNKKVFNGKVRMYKDLNVTEGNNNSCKMLTFVGEVKNGKINGKGKEYNNMGFLIYVKFNN